MPRGEPIVKPLVGEPQETILRLFLFARTGVSPQRPQKPAHSAFLFGEVLFTHLERTQQIRAVATAKEEQQELSSCSLTLYGLYLGYIREGVMAMLG